MVFDFYFDGVTVKTGNRPFYSCGSVTRPMNGSEAAGDTKLFAVLMQMQVSSHHNNIIYMIKTARSV